MRLSSPPPPRPIPPLLCQIGRYERAEAECIDQHPGAGRCIPLLLLSDSAQLIDGCLLLVAVGLFGAFDLWLRWGGQRLVADEGFGHLTGDIVMMLHGG